MTEKKIATFRDQAAQGDVLVTRIEALPEGCTKVSPTNGKYIVAHSETGHHHYLAAIGVEVFTTQDPLVCFLRASAPCDLVHDRSFDTHISLRIEPGIYEIQRPEEYTPAGWRQIED